MKSNSTSIQLEVNGSYLVVPGEVAEAFATLLNSVFDYFLVLRLCTPTSCLTILLLLSVVLEDILNASKTN
jgi:hypothetical protein